MKRWAVAAVLGAVAFSTAGNAHAATVSVDPDRYYRFNYSQADGETNDVRFEYSAADRAWTVRDTGAPLTAGPGCTVTGDTATCANPDSGFPPHQRVAWLETGDGEDEIEIVSSTGTLAVLDGPGADRVAIRPGVGGVDMRPGAGPDVFEVEHDGVYLDYDNPGVGVTMTIDGVADDGPPGEGDNIVGPWRLVGTPHADRIVAGSWALRADGVNGDDTIIGGPGNDVIEGGVGATTLLGEGGDDHVIADAEATGGTVSGGAGNDRAGFDGRTVHGLPYKPVSLDGAANDLASGKVNVLADFEEVNVGYGSIVGGPRGEFLSGERVGGGGGDDVITAGHAAGGPGRDIIHATLTVDAADGEADVVRCPNPAWQDFEWKTDPFDDVSGCVAAQPKYGVVGPLTATTRVDSRGYFVVRLRCDAGSPIPCAGNIALRSRGGRTQYAVGRFHTTAPGKSRRVRLKVAARYRRTLARGRSLTGSLMVQTKQTDTTTLRTSSVPGKVVVKPQARKR